MSDFRRLVRLYGVTLFAYRGSMETGLSAKSAKLGRSESPAYPKRELFEESYLRLRDPIFRYVRRFVSSDDDAADLTAKTFERALSKLSSYRGEQDNFGAWLFRIARSQAVDATRRRRPLHPLDLIRPEQHPYSIVGQPELELMQREASRELADQVRHLPPLQQECLSLRYGAGLTNRQIGSVIGKSEAATQKLISRALSQLRETFS
jgi:RNA polymerase sigma-70 factor, ECF subfamily